MALTETGFVFAPRVPRGLGPAVEGLAREILRHRPRDVYAFAARHFEELIELREKERVAIDVVSATTIRDCELPYSERVRGPGNGARNDSKSCDERTRIREIVDLMEGSARKESKKSLKRRRKESAARNRSGWSVTETVKAFEKHGGENDLERRNRNRKLEKIGSDYFERCSPRSSKIAYRYLRSSSAGDILAKIVGSRRSRENRGKVCDLPPRRAAEAFEEEAGRKKNSVDLAETVKRRESGDQFERSCAHVQSASEAGCDGRGECLATDESEREDHRLVVEEFDVCRNRQDRPEASVGDDRTELSNCEKAFRDAVSKDDEINEINEINVITIDRRVSEGSMPIHRYGYTENSVVLPSVTARPSSSNGSSRSGIQNDVSMHSNDLILPPISSDAVKPADREDNVTLPLLSKAPEVPVDRRTTQSVSCEREDFKLENVEQRLETRDPLITDYDSIDTDTEHRVAVTDERDADTAIDGVPSKDERADDEDDGNNDNETMGVVETARASNWPETEVDEIFRDSLNVTPDSVELSTERTDSLERLSTEETNEERVESSRQPNELKKKLIEIEAVERSIESTLASGTIVGRTEESAMSSFDLGKESVPLDERESARQDRSSEVERTENENIVIDLTESGKLESPLESFDENNEDEVKQTVDESSIRVTTEGLLKEIDLSCYVLAEDVSPREIPDSVTTVIIPDETRPSDDEAFDSDRRTEDDSGWNGETQQEPREGLPFGDEGNPFGEVVSPTSNTEYSTNIETDFLNGIRNAVDRKVVRRDTLRDIREEDESGREGADTEGARFMLVSGDTGCPVPLDSQFLGSENASVKSTIAAIDSGKLDRDAVDDRETTSSPISNTSDARNESLVRERTKDTDTQTEVDRTPSLEECPRPSHEPFVPELNLDSLRDATISSSSFERNDSRNCSSRSEKESDYVTLHQGGEISTGTLPVPFEAETVVDHREDRRAEVEDESEEVCEKDGDSIEEEIAKELIRNLSFDASSPSSSSTSKVIENPEECETKNAGSLEESNDSLNHANATSDSIDPAMLCSSIETSSRRTTDDPQQREKEDGAQINGALCSTEDEKIDRETFSSSLLEITSPLNRDRFQVNISIYKRHFNYVNK